MAHFEDIELAWKAFKDQPDSERAKYFMNENGSLQSLLMSQQMSLDMLNHLCQVSDAVRELADNKPGALFLKQLLPHKALMVLFREVSSRTRTSFERAGQILGMSVIVNDDLETSSEVKGESALDTVQTFSEYVDVIAMRHPEVDFVEKAAWHLKTNTRRPVGVVNGGSGPNQHPTQAQLDWYTISRKPGWNNVKTMVFAGDLARSRTVRSLCYLLKFQPHVRVIFVAPEERFQIKHDIRDFFNAHHIAYELVSELEPVVPLADVIYMTRIQDNFNKPGEEAPRYFPTVAFYTHMLRLLKPHAIVAHPLPRRDELDARCDTDPRIQIWSEVRNGMWMRAAGFANMFGVDHEILDMYSEVYRKGVKA